MWVAIKKSFLSALFLLLMIFTGFAQEDVGLIGTVKIKKPFKEVKIYTSASREDSTLTSHYYLNDMGLEWKHVGYIYQEGKLDTSFVTLSVYDSLNRITKKSIWDFHSSILELSNLEWRYPNTTTEVITRTNKDFSDTIIYRIHKRLNTTVSKRYRNGKLENTNKVKKKNTKEVFRNKKPRLTYWGKTVDYFDSNHAQTEYCIKSISIHFSKRYKKKVTINKTVGVRTNNLQNNPLSECSLDNKKRKSCRYWEYR